jgi:hypothetical protein
VAALSLLAACSGGASTSTSTTACPPTGGGVSGTHIGAIVLGVSSPQAGAAAEAAGRHAGRHPGMQFEEFFRPHLGVRVGYASPVLVPYAQHAYVPGSASYANRVVWISTSNPVYVVDGIQLGDSISTTRAWRAPGSC